MNCICILKSITLDRIENNFKDQVNFKSVSNIEELRFEISSSDYDFAILDYNNYNYHELNSYLIEKNINTYIFDGKFDKLELFIEEQLEQQEPEEPELKKEVQIIEKYIEKKVEVEKIVEKKVEVEVEKIVEKRVYKKVKIVVASQKKGIGCTHYCFSIANHLKNLKYNVAIVEIGKNELSDLKKNKIDIVHFNTIDEYYSDKEIRKYDYVIIDIGYYKRENFKELYLSSDFKIVILGSKEWETNNMKYFFKDIGDLRAIKDLYYIFNFATDSQFEDISSDMYGLKTYKGVYSDCFKLNEEMQALIDNILDTYLEVKNKKINLGSIFFGLILISIFVAIALKY